MDWLDVIPSIMSALASVAAAFAAFGSLRISREAKSVAEQSALAVHHGTAAIELSNAVETIEINTKEFSNFAYHMWSDWAREIGAKDQRQMGGSNPRPLRHVLTNASEMLVQHGTRQGINYKHAQRSMFSIVRNGVNDLNDDEYENLLRTADGEYLDFENIFGAPKLTKSITDSLAFRWACHQLKRRIDEDEWHEVWKESWMEDGWLNKYRNEHFKIKPTLELILYSLKEEKTKLENSVFPLESNPTLFFKYDNMINILEVLLEDCSLESLEVYREWPHREDLAQLVVYSMGVAFLAMESLGSVYGYKY